MDPRRKLDERFGRTHDGRVPFLTTSRETVLEAQHLGGPIKREIIVIRVEKQAFKLYTLIACFLAILAILSGIAAD